MRFEICLSFLAYLVFHTLFFISTTFISYSSSRSSLGIILTVWLGTQSSETCNLRHALKKYRFDTKICMFRIPFKLGPKSNHCSYIRPTSFLNIYRPTTSISKMLTETKTEIGYITNVMFCM